MVEPNCIDVSARLADMDRAAVNVQLVSTVPVMFSYWVRDLHQLSTKETSSRAAAAASCFAPE